MSVQREPAIRKAHPASDLPERPTSTEAAVPSGPTSTPAASSVQAAPVLVQSHHAPAAEKLSEQHNVRLRPSTKARLIRAVDKLRYETGDRSINISSVTDAAIIDYLTSRNC